MIYLLKCYYMRLRSCNANYMLLAIYVVSYLLATLANNYLLVGALTDIYV